MSSRQLVIGIIFCISVAALIVACLAYTKKPKGEHFNLKKTQSFSESRIGAPTIPPPKKFWTTSGKGTHFKPVINKNNIGEISNMSTFLDGKWTVYNCWNNCRCTASRILIEKGQWKSVVGAPPQKGTQANDIKTNQLQFEWAAVPTKFFNGIQDKACGGKDKVYNWPSAIGPDFLENTGRLRVTYMETIPLDKLKEVCHKSDPNNPGVANLTEPLKVLYSAVVCAPMGNNGAINVPNNTLTNVFAINNPIIWDFTGLPANYGTSDPNAPKLGHDCFPFAGLPIPQKKLIWIPGWVGEEADVGTQCPTCGIQSPPGGDLNQSCTVGSSSNDDYSLAKMSYGGTGGECVWNSHEGDDSAPGLKCVPTSNEGNQGTCEL